MNDLSHYFNEFVEVRFATSGWVVDETRRLRYRVYCKEEGFEDPARFPDGMEKDEHDTRAIHCLVLHRPTGLVFEPVGTRVTVGNRSRQPCRACLQDLLDRVRHVRCDLWVMLSDHGRFLFHHDYEPPGDHDIRQ
jgi:hypothetical protein